MEERGKEKKGRKNEDRIGRIRGKGRRGKK
jgi:hypothetical protein